jgi:hypothetical protein
MKMLGQPKLSSAAPIGHADHRGEPAANGLQRPQPEDDFYGFGQGDEHGRGREDD